MTAKDYEKNSESRYKKNYFVVQVRYEDGGWRVVRVDKDRRESLLTTYGRKKTAKQKAISLAKKHRPSKVQIYYQDGSYQKNMSYPRRTRRGY